MKKTYLALVVCILILAGARVGSADGYHGGGHYRCGWGGPAFRGSIWIGPGWGGWGWVPPVSPYYAPQVIIPQQTPLYPEPQQSQPEEQGYWYYCPNPAGYYPYVKKCPEGWLKVVPTPTPPNPKE